jgi:hypothetical protein
MTAQQVATPDPVMFSAWREYRLSLVLLATGIVLVVAIGVFTLWANSTGHYPTSFWTGLALEVTPTAGGMLILLAGTVAYYHRSFLRKSRGAS